jgi:glycosyltransferase involved in cell wall biosynthesis
LRLARLSKNSGTASVPRNEALRIACGDYVFFLDSDDRISEITLERALRLAHKNNSDLVCTPYWSDTGRAVSRSAFCYASDMDDVLFEEIKLYNTLNIVGKLVRREILVAHNILFPPNIRLREDNLFTMKCYAAARKISILGNRDKFYYCGGKIPIIFRRAKHHLMIFLVCWLMWCNLFFLWNIFLLNEK